MFLFKTEEMGAPRGQVIGPGWFTEIPSFIHVTVVVPIIWSVKAALSLHQNGSLNIHPLSWCKSAKPFPQAPGAFFLSGPAASSKESQNTPQPPLSSTNSSPGRRSQGKRSWLDDGGLSLVALLLLVTLLGPRTWM